MGILKIYERDLKEYVRFRLYPNINVYVRREDLPSEENPNKRPPVIYSETGSDLLGVFVLPITEPIALESIARTYSFMKTLSVRGEEAVRAEHDSRPPKGTDVTPKSDDWGSD